MAHLLPIRQAEDITKKIEARAKLIDAEARKITAEHLFNVDTTDNQDEDSETATQTQTRAQRFNDQRNNIPRPKIDENCTDSDWAFFKAQWSRYILGTHMTPQQEIHYIWDACSKTLQRNLHNGAGNRIQDPKVLLEHLKLLAVKGKNNLVNIVELQRMGQGHQETVMQYSTRLNGQTDLCDFTVECTGCGESVSYKDKTIMHQFIKGLADQQTQE